MLHGVCVHKVPGYHSFGLVVPTPVDADLARDVRQGLPGRRWRRSECPSFAQCQQSWSHGPPNMQPPFLTLRGRLLSAPADSLGFLCALSLVDLHGLGKKEELEVEQSFGIPMRDFLPVRRADWEAVKE
jgi:hypothetical protein